MKEGRRREVRGRVGVVLVVLTSGGLSPKSASIWNFGGISYKPTSFHQLDEC